MDYITRRPGKESKVTDNSKSSGLYINADTNKAIDTSSKLS